MLKGLDTVVWEILRNLGLDAWIKGVLTCEDVEGDPRFVLGENLRYMEDYHVSKPFLKRRLQSRVLGSCEKECRLLADDHIGQG